MIVFDLTYEGGHIKMVNLLMARVDLNINVMDRVIIELIGLYSH